MFILRTLALGFRSTMTMMMKAVLLPYPPSLSTLPARTIASFADLEHIGQGGNGVVYRGRDKATGNIYALKKLELNPDSSDNILDLVEREIHFLSTYRHKSIIGFHEVLVPQADHAGEEGYIYVVMEYAERDLFSQMDIVSRPYREDEARTIMSDVLEGVHFLHSKGVIHRDIKTQNLLVTSTGKVKICDFDFCRYGRRDDVGKPGNYTTRVGTPGYAAPEILLDEGKYSAAVDVWSLGCVMAELLLFEDRLFGLDCCNVSMEEELDAIQELLLSNERCLRDKFPPEMLSEDGFDLLSRMLAVFPENRITAEDALSHPWFKKP